MTNVRNAVAEVEKPGPGALVAQKRDEFALVLPSHLKADQWVRVAQGVVRRDRNLQKVALANPASLLSALLDCAHLGLEPGDTYHLVPFGNEIVGITDYTGEIELMYRTGAVAKVEAQVVKANDEFVYRPKTMDRPDHDAEWFGDRGALVGVYAYALFKDGAVSRVVVMGETEIAPIRAMSKNKTLWEKHPESCWLKSAVHQLRKWVPTSAEYRSEVLRAEARAGEVAERMGIPSGSSAYDDDVIEGEVVEDGPEGVDPNGVVEAEAQG